LSTRTQKQDLPTISVDKSLITPLSAVNKAAIDGCLCELPKLSAQ
jgi:hypothetical protein